MHVRIIFSGLPGAGKSTIARQLAAEVKAVSLRIDTVEHALPSCDWLKTPDDIGPAGYDIACAVALDNLRLGRERTPQARGGA